MRTRTLNKIIADAKKRAAELSTYSSIRATFEILSVDDTSIYFRCEDWEEGIAYNIYYSLTDSKENAYDSDWKFDYVETSN